ncbi:Senescence regulator S40 [Sesbania bispinosa]|nr:Senescence regulator S40 [Sesbania bispinosa]
MVPCFCCVKSARIILEFGKINRTQLAPGKKEGRKNCALDPIEGPPSRAFMPPFPLPRNLHFTRVIILERLNRTTLSSFLHQVEWRTYVTTHRLSSPRKKDHNSLSQIYPPPPPPIHSKPRGQFGKGFDQPKQSTKEGSSPVTNLNFAEFNSKPKKARLFMATTSKGHIGGRPTYRFLPSMDRDYSLSDSTFEFDESELYNNSARGDEYRQSRRRNNDDEDEDDEVHSGDGDGGDRVPPHEFLARTRIASFSVHEGIGRTLKGRDLSRVRNAIWGQNRFPRLDPTRTYDYRIHELINYHQMRVSKTGILLLCVGRSKSDILNSHRERSSSGSMIGEVWVLA